VSRGLWGTILFGVLAFGCGSSPSDPGFDDDDRQLSVADVIVTVDAGRAFQTMAGFGGDIAPWHLAGLTEADQATLLRGAAQEIGLNTFRMNLVYHEGASATDFWGNNDNGDPFSIDWTRFDFCTVPVTWCNEDWDRMLPILRQGGSTGEYWGLIQGPRWNGFASAGPFNVDEMVENQLAAFLYLRDRLGLTVNWVAPFSEPGGGGINWVISPPEATEVVKRLGARLQANGFSVKMIVPDATSVGGSVAFARTILMDPDAKRFVGAIGYHTYDTGGGGENPSVAWRNTREEVRALGENFGVPVRMTEFADESGLMARANHIFNELEYAHSQTYHPQHVFASGDHPGGDPRASAGGILYFRTGSNGRLTDWGPTRFTGVAIGHYSRFAAPGSIRVSATGEDPQVRTQAFHDREGDRLSVVVINNKSTEERIEISLEGVSRGGAVDGIQTAESDGFDQYWSNLSGVETSGGSRVQFVARPRSVTSLSIRL
jgi:hypothetical protein